MRDYYKYTLNIIIYFDSELKIYFIYICRMYSIFCELFNMENDKVTNIIINLYLMSLRFKIEHI